MCAHANAALLHTCARTWCTYPFFGLPFFLPFVDPRIRSYGDWECCELHLETESRRAKYFISRSWIFASIKYSSEVISRCLDWSKALMQHFEGYSDRISHRATTSTLYILKILKVSEVGHAQALHPVSFAVRRRTFESGIENLQVPEICKNQPKSQRGKDFVQRLLVYLCRTVKTNGMHDEWYRHMDKTMRRDKMHISREYFPFKFGAHLIYLCECGCGCVRACVLTNGIFCTWLTLHKAASAAITVYSQWWWCWWSLYEIASIFDAHRDWRKMKEEKNRKRLRTRKTRFFEHEEERRMMRYVMYVIAVASQLGFYRRCMQRLWAYHWKTKCIYDRMFFIRHVRCMILLSQQMAGRKRRHEGSEKLKIHRMR